jgi:hypothetical protein
VIRRFPSPLTLALACVLAASPRAVDAQTPDVPFVQVSGTAQVFVPSDRARLNFAVVTEAETAAEAAALNSTRMEAAIAALRATGAAGLRIESWGYDLQPRYARPTPGGQEQPLRIIGYQATNNVRATVDDVDAVGRLIDAAVSGGANRVTSLRFEARNTDAARADALRQAVQNARSQAEAMAAALGAPLGPPIEVHGGAQAPMPPPMPYMERGMAYDQAMVDTPIEAAESSVSAHVTVKFRLGTP